MVEHVNICENSQGIWETSIILKKIEKKHKTLEERAKEFGGKLGPYEEFNWGAQIEKRDRREQTWQKKQ